MSDPMIPADRREFRCIHCDGKILIPVDLPPTTGPCPHCSGVITSPAPESPAPAADSRSSSTGSRSASRSRSAPVEILSRRGAATSARSGRKNACHHHPRRRHRRRRRDSGTTVRSRQSRSHGGTFRSTTFPRKNPLPRKANGPQRPDPRDAGAARPRPRRRRHFLFRLEGESAIRPAAHREGHRAIPRVNEANYIRIGWQKDAYELLAATWRPPTARAKLPFILNGEELAPKIEEFYGGGTSWTPTRRRRRFRFTNSPRKTGNAGFS